MNACAMVARCLRHQMSDLFGGENIQEPALPTELRYGIGDSYVVTPTLPEESMGHPEAIRLE